MTITVHTINDQNMAYWHVPKNTMREMRFEEDYLPGVVAAEMGDCKELEALKAQAIAARSFAWQYLLKGAAIYDTGKAQAYLASRAVSTAYEAHRHAVADTEGIILTFNGKPVSTHYSASNGGHVQNGHPTWEVPKDDPWDNSGKLSGHGAGMSQNGAQNMAKAGKSYQEILAFYYPATELKSDYGKVEVNNVADVAINFDAIVNFARAQVGEPYSLGSHGPNQWDCSGLTKDATEQIGYKWVHSSNRQWDNGFKAGNPATFGYWKTSGTLDTMSMNEVVFLFHYGKLSSGNGAGMVHVGIFDPATQTVIQAGGYLAHGVHEDSYSKAKKYFSHWATIKAYGWVSPPTPAYPTMRKGSEGECVIVLQRALNAHGANPMLITDGKFGQKTKDAVLAYQKASKLVQDGVAGPKTQRALGMIT
jgi:cell wall-associated NlpC family hydrolase